MNLCTSGIPWPDQELIGTVSPSPDQGRSGPAGLGEGLQEVGCPMRSV